MRIARYAVIFALGFFALAAQTLLFRDFLTAFEGNELGVGSFFASWLLWVGLGAMAGRRQSRLAATLTARFELAPLLYLPTFLVQQYLILHARQLGGVSPYEVYPFARMFAVCALANGPISFVTGLLFTLACRWWSRQPGLPVARVYIVETFGSFIGGLVVTGLLAVGLAAEPVFVTAAVVLAAGAAMGWLARPAEPRSRWPGPMLLALLLLGPALLLSGLAGRWSRHNDRVAWSRLLPAEEYRGSFTTAQAKYLYGQREGQFVVMAWGGVIEAVPNREHGGEVAALSMAQRPAARRILVVGPGSLAICLAFAALPQVRQVVWLHPDPQYPPALWRVLPTRLRKAAGPLSLPGSEVRRFLAASPRRFDLILLNLPEATTLVLNRYWTRQFFQLAKGALADDGVLCTRLTGAANYMGGELIYLGSSALQTLRSVFRHVVLKPGDESWLIASDGSGLSAAPAELRDRFAAVPGAAAVYPPDGLMSLYVPDRIQFQMAKYAEAAAATDPAVLLNSDQRPKALLFSLLLALRKTGLLSFSRHVPVMLAGGLWIAASPVLLYGLLRLLYLLAPRGKGAVRWRLGTVGSAAPGATFDCLFLIFATGLAGMSLSIVLMFLYQSHFGSLFLYIGLISSLFMLGSCLGGLATERLLSDRGSEPPALLPVCLLLHVALVLALLLLPERSPAFLYAGLFGVCGLFVGVYFPIAAHRLRSAGRSAAAAGASLEMLDHLGGAAGAVLAGWLLLPVLGTQAAVAVLALLVAVNLVPNLAPARVPYAPTGGDRFDRLVRPAGYTMVGLAAFFLAASHIVAAVRTGQEERLLVQAARAMAGAKARLVERQAPLPDGERLRYWTVTGSDGAEDGFVFSTDRLVHDVYGYGGPVVLAVYVAPDGLLREVRIIRSQETPAYVKSLQGWLKQELPGHNLFAPPGLQDVDAVSGATMTSEAVLRTLEQAGRRFAAAALGLRVEGGQRPPAPAGPDRQFVCLALLLALAVGIRHLPSVWLRRAFLLATLLLTGLLWNLQYSSQQVMALLSLRLPGNWLGGSFVLVLVVPLAVALFGNVYCGYVCPFGALQELVGDLRPAELATDPDKRTWRYGRAVKYVLLLLLVVLFVMAGDYGVLSADPLITVFSSLRDRWVLWFGAAMVLLSLVYRRFWCRNLCPAGAFLALLCGVRLLRRLVPTTGPGRCDLGVRAAGELDCLCCDRCRHEKD